MELDSSQEDISWSLKRSQVRREAISAAFPDSMERVQGSVVRSSVQDQDHGRGAGGPLTGDRRHASTGSSQNSARGHRAICGTGA